MKPKPTGATPKRYPSDLTRNQWKRLKRLLPPAKPGGRPRTVKLREILNGIFYIVRGGCSWRMMPKDLPPWSTCYDYFRKWRNDGTWAKINDALRTQVRTGTGRRRVRAWASSTPKASRPPSRAVRGARTPTRKSMAGSGT